MKYLKTYVFSTLAVLLGGVFTFFTSFDSENLLLLGVVKAFDSFNLSSYYSRRWYMVLSLMLVVMLAWSLTHGEGYNEFDL